MTPSKYLTNVQDAATVVVLTCAFSWGNVTDKQMTEDVTTDNRAVRGALRVRKTLLPDASGNYVRAVQHELAKFYGYHRSVTYDTPIVGQRLMPVAFYIDYMKEYGTARDKALEALEALKAAYPDSVTQAKALLGSSFKADDYPPVDEIDRYFKFDKPLFLPVPKGDNIMNALGAAVAADVDNYTDTMMKTAAADAKTRLINAVKLMAERLTTKGSKIYDSMPDTINELARTLPTIAGLAGDDDLQAMIKEVKDTLSGYSGDDFRGNEGARTQVGAAAMAMLKKMGG
jgi:hypothetical protein